MPQNKNINTFENGLVRVDNPTKQPKNSYPFALNVIINDIVTDPSSRTNEKSQDFYFNINSGTNTNILGYIWLGLEEYVVFIKNFEGESVYNIILHIDLAKQTTRVLYNSPLLNFQDNYEIKGTYRINYKNQRIIYFVDGLNDDRVLNIDTDSTALDISLLSIGESATKPSIEATVSDTGGSISAGQYFIAISYNLGTDFTTTPTSLTREISIAKEKYFNNITITPTINDDFGQTDGDLFPTPTNKSIIINVDNLDNKFTSYNLYIVKYNSDASIIAKKIDNISLVNTTYIYTGNEGVIDDTITLNSILVESIKYYASEAIIQKENRLVRGNSKLKASAINYQAFANNINVRYIINEELVYNQDLQNNIVESTGNPNNYLPKDEVYKKQAISPSYLSNAGNNDQDNKSFMRDEVYSLGIGFEFTDGSETPVFHIPGRIPNTLLNTSGVGEYGRIYTGAWDTSLTTSGEFYWRERNTALNNGILGYWRSNLTYTDGYNYPTNGEQTGGKSYIRHHKMPSDVLEPLFRTDIVGDANGENNFANYKLYKRHISLQFNNIQIPEEYSDLISKVKIFYTPRTQDRKTILSKGLLCDLKNENDGETAFRLDHQSEGKVMESNTNFEFYSPDVNFKFKENNLLGTRLKVNALYKSYIQYIGDKTVRPLLGGIHFTRFYYDKLGRRQAMLVPTQTFLLSDIPKEHLYTRDLTKFIYVDAGFTGTTDGFTLDFLGSQPTSIIEVDQPLIAKPLIVATPLASYYPNLRYPSGSDISEVIYDKLESDNGEFEGQTYWQDRVFYNTVYYVSLVNDNTNLYGKIESLDYINIGNINKADFTNTITVNSGDTYIDMHHVRKTYVKLVEPDRTPQPYAINLEAPVGDDVEQFEDVNEFDVNTYVSFMCETDINIRMRAEDETEESKYFPKMIYSTPVFGLENLYNYVSNFAMKQKYFIEPAYNTQYLKYNYANQTTQEEFNQTSTDIRYSTRIIYSDKQELEDKTDNFRVVRANNYRDLPLNRGPITIFFTKQDKLYAVTRDSLFDVFASNQTIKSENADNIVVGTGEFLSIEPVELISIDGGYGGTSSKFSLVESPFGYLFVDRNKNKCFLFNEQLKDLNILGLNENFKLELYKQFPQMEAENGFDNPIIVGITAVYDPRLQRIIITKKDYKLIDTTGTITFTNGYIRRNGNLLDYNDSTIFENKSFTVSFDPINTKWISYHSYIPSLYISHNTDFLSYYRDNDLLISNGQDYTKFIIETIFNENPLYTKTTDSLNINAVSFDGEDRSNDFFNGLLVYNDQQSSGYIELNSTNLTRKEKDWNINKFLDKSKHQLTKPLFTKDWTAIKEDYYIDKVVNPLAIDNAKPWYQMARFRDKYLIARFSYEKLQMKKIIINFVNSIYRVSSR